jgi:hypothetical protein
MPVASVTLGLAVVTHNVYHSLKISRHGMLGDISGACFPSSRHGLLGYDRLFANGASIIKAGKFAEAMRMNRMTTRQILGRLAGREHIFSADRAIVLVFVLEALVSIKDTDGYAHAAFVAVPEGIDASNAAKATLHAVKRFL